MVILVAGLTGTVLEELQAMEHQSKMKKIKVAILMAIKYLL